MKSPRPPLRSGRAPPPTRPARAGAPKLSRLTASVVADLARATRYVDPDLMRLWPTLAGSEIAALCRPGRLTGGPVGRTLEVIVSNGASAASVEFASEGLRRRLNDYFGPDAVARILVIQASGPPAPRPGGLSRFRTG